MKSKNPLKNRKKVAIVLFFSALSIFIIFAARFSFIMVKGEVNGEDLDKNVNNLYTRSSVLEANRGTIYDVGGDPVAVDATSYSLYAVLTDKWSSKSTKPQYVTEKEKTAESLAKYLPMSKQNILSRLNKSADQVEFGSAGKNLSYEIKKGIEDDNLSGIFFKETPIRLYPNGTFSSHLIGMAQLPTDKNGEMKEDSELTGYMGIEQAYNSDLTGKDGGTEYKKDSFGYVLPSAETKTTQPKDGKDIYLTLDKRMQVYLESIMTEVNDEYSPKAVTATLMDPKTGAIVATSQRPSFNGTTKEGIDQLWQNLLAEYSYEPGSTFKVLTLAAAVNEGVFNPNETYQSGSVKVADRVIRDVNRNGWGTISYLEGVERSSNVAFVNLMKKMGPEVWKNYLDKFGIGKSTNSGLLNESDGSNPYNYAAEKATSSFGQGLTVTVLQMLQAFSAVANDGKMMKPHYISKFVDPNTQEEKMIKPEVVSEPISKKAAHQTLDYLKNVVYGENGTGKRFQIEGYEIAAKTGTAQIVNPETKNYFSGGNNYIYSVVGMAPANDPEYLLYVTVQQPKINKPGIAGGDVVAEIFNPVMKRALEYSHLNEEDKQNENQVEMPKGTSMSKEEAIAKLEEIPLDTAVIGNGDKVIQQLPYPKEKVIKNQKAVLMTNGAMTMPDLTGWSKNDVLKVSELTGVEFDFKGEGFVTSQSLAADSLLNPDESISVELQPDSTEN